MTSEMQDVPDVVIAGSRSAWLRRLTLALVWLAYLATPPYPTVDTLGTLPIAISLLEDGDFDLSEWSNDPAPPMTSANGDRRYSFFPWGPGVAAVPFVAVLRGALQNEPAGVWLFTQLIGLPMRDGTGHVDLRASLISHRPEIERLIASTYCVIALAFLWSLMRRRHGDWLAAAVTLAMAFGSSSWTTSSRMLWQHGPSVVCGTAALWALQAANRRGTWVALAGALAALAYTMRPTNSLVVVCFAAYVALQNRRQLPAYLGGAGLVVLVFVAINLSTYGTMLPPYYVAGRILEGEFSTEALAGLLVSPSRGLFVFSPFLLLAPLTLLWCFRSRRLSALDATCWAIVALHLFAVSMFEHWWGGGSWGPRLLVDLQPFLAWVLLPQGLVYARPVIRALVFSGFGVLSAASVGVHARYLDGATHKWDGDPVSVEFCPSRLWDWRDPSFLRGTRFDGRHEPLSVAGDELAFRVLGPIPGLEGVMPIIVSPGRYVVAVHVFRCRDMQGGFRWSVEGVGASEVMTLHDELVPVVADGTVLDLVADSKLEHATRLLVRVHAADERVGRFWVRLTIRRLA